MIFLLDASGSVGASNYLKEKEFIKIVVSRYDLETVNQAAVIVFSTQASNVVPLGSKKTSLSFASSVDNIPYDQGWTRIDLALRLAYDEYFSAHNSNETQKLVILLTDGKQTRGNFLSTPYIPIEDTAQILRSKSARIFAVAIGHYVNISEMRMVTEREEDIFQIMFHDLVAKADTISKTSCVDARKSKPIFYFYTCRVLNPVTRRQLNLKAIDFVVGLRDKKYNSVSVLWYVRCVSKTFLNKTYMRATTGLETRRG